MTEITPGQALANLDAAVSELQLTRPQHLLLARSVEVLDRMIRKAAMKEEAVVEIVDTR